MPGNVCKLERAHIRIRERLSPLEKDWLIGRLVSGYGVHRAISSDEHPRELIIEYYADRMNRDLIDVFYLCGLHVESMPT